MLVRVSILLTSNNLSLTRLDSKDVVKNDKVMLFDTFLDASRVGVAKRALLDKNRNKW